MEWVWSGYVYVPGPLRRVWSRYGVGMYTYQDLGVGYGVGTEPGPVERYAVGVVDRVQSVDHPREEPVLRLP